MPLPSPEVSSEIPDIPIFLGTAAPKGDLFLYINH
jgi:hypothetical protein